MWADNLAVWRVGQRAALKADHWELLKAVQTADQKVVL
jgi:hypothetical protein